MTAGQATAAKAAEEAALATDAEEAKSSSSLYCFLIFEDLLQTLTLCTVVCPPPPRSRCEVLRRCPHTMNYVSESDYCCRSDLECLALQKLSERRLLMKLLMLVIKACKPPLLQVTTLMNKVKKVLGIYRVKRLRKKVAVIH